MIEMIVFFSLSIWLDHRPTAQPLQWMLTFFYFSTIPSRPRTKSPSTLQWRTFQVFLLFYNLTGLQTNRPTTSMKVNFFLLLQFQADRGPTAQEHINEGDSRFFYSFSIRLDYRPTAQPLQWKLFFSFSAIPSRPRTNNPSTLLVIYIQECLYYSEVDLGFLLFTIWLACRLCLNHFKYCLHLHCQDQEATEDRLCTECSRHSFIVCAYLHQDTIIVCNSAGKVNVKR